MASLALALIPALAMTLTGCDDDPTEPESVELAISVEPSGAGSVFPGRGAYRQGTEVEVEAQPNPGYRFQGWQGDLSGSENPRTIVLDGEVKATALFEEVAVEFADEALEEVVRSAVDLPTGTLWASDLDGLTELTAPEAGIRDLAGLVHARDLRRLELRGNEIATLESLGDGGLPGLEEVDLGDNRFGAHGVQADQERAALAVVEGWTSLQALQLDGNRIEGVAPLLSNDGLGSGTSVDLSGNPLRSEALCEDVPTLEGHGVEVGFDGACGTPTLAPERFPLTVDGRQVELPFDSNRPIDQRDEGVERVVVVLHGLGYDALQYRDHGLNALAEAPGSAQETLVVAPQFARDEHVDAWAVSDDLLHWDGSPFWGSQQALAGSAQEPVLLSSFRVLDEMIQALADLEVFPSLQEVVVAGYSAGGQFSQRYAVSSPLEGQLEGSVAIRYLVMAPSSYVYLDENRPDASEPDGFAPPDDPSCPDFNSYGYGLEDLWAYHDRQEVSPEAMREQYEERRVRYLVGGDDDDPDHHNLATGCEAMLQGEHRVERALSFHDYLRFFYGEGIGERHDVYVVPGVPHSGGGTLTSEAAVDFLVGKGAASHP